MLDARRRISDYFPWLDYDEESHIFHLDGNYIGFGFTATPLNGYTRSMDQRFKTLLTTEYPEGTFLQFNLCVFDDVSHHINKIGRVRGVSKDPLIREATKDAQAFYRDIAEGRKDIDMPLRNASLVISLKMPTEEMYPNKDETTEILRIKNELTETLKAIGFRDLTPLTEVELVHQTSIILNRQPSASWRNGRRVPEVSEFLRKDVLDPATGIDIHNKHLKVGDSYVTSLGVKKYPHFNYFGCATAFSIDAMTGTRGIFCPHMITGTVYFQNQTDIKTSVARKRQTNQYYADGPYGRFVPKYGVRAAEYKAVEKSLNDGHALHKISLCVTLFSNSEAEAERNTAQARTYLSELGYSFLPNEFVLFPILRMNLPFGPEKNDIRDLSCFRSHTSNAISTFLPCFFEWRGTNDPMLTFIGRAGQIMGFSPFDSGTNYNLTVSAESGSGKSFLCNDLICSFLGAAGKVWVIDVGGSYLKLNEALGGQHLQFGENSDIVLNPFSSLHTKADFDEVADILLNLLAVMAAPRNGLTDFQEATLKTALTRLYAQFGNQLNIDRIVEYLFEESKKQEDGGKKELRISDIAYGLQIFGSQGQYGRYFNGPSNIDFSSNFVLLELEELKSQKHLQTIVLLLLIYQINHGMYLGDKGQKKLMLIDEAWDLLSNNMVAGFIESGFRRLRKYNGSACVVTQSLLDLHGSSTGQAILANSASTIMLQQKDTTLAQLSSGDAPEFSKELARLLGTVHTIPGRYSESYFRCHMGDGIGRLVVSDFFKLLFSTRPSDTAEIKRYTDTGMTNVEAIKEILKQRGQL